MPEYAIFFDVDGVLINGFHSNPDLTNRWDKNIEADLGIRKEDLTEQFFKGPFMDVIIGQRDCLEALDEVLPEISGNVTSQQLLDYWFQKDSVLNEDVMRTVRVLSESSHAELYIATNQEHYRAKYLWNDLGFKNYFKDIYYSARLGCFKENPDYFKQIIDEQNLENRQVIFFDDTPKNIKVAQSYGWDGVVYNHIDDLNKHPVIESILKERLVA